MRSMTVRSSAGLAALIVTIAVILGACSSGGGTGDKAGGSGGPVVLKMANTSSEMRNQPAVEDFARRVKTLSGGAVRIEAVNEWGNFAADSEQTIVRAVAQGKIDLAWVGSRVFDTLGVKDFQALTAPMLLDSYALQDAVIKDGITTKMLRGLQKLDVVGLGVVPDALRRPIGVGGPIVKPGDWDGITFGTFSSNSQNASIQALEGVPKQVFGHERKDALKSGTLDGFEFGLFAYQRDPFWLQSAPYVTVNVNLWPQMDVLLADPSRFEDLSDKQRGWLRQAAKEAARDSSMIADLDASAVSGVCDAGGRFATATKADLAALQDAFAPVYTTLEKDPGTKASIDRIRELKGSIHPEAGLVVPAGCTGKAPNTEPTASEGAAPRYLNGTYRYVLTQKDADAVGDTDTGYPVVTTITLKDGAMNGGCFESGTYTVADKQITFHSDAYNTDSAVTFSRDDKGSLKLTPVPPMDPGDAFACFYKTWVKIK
jgi:TRAP-type C4-dicarboxylate transport system substrate-binding protein